MNLKNLDYASIIAMYENAGKKGIADNFIYKALDNYSDDKNPGDYDFLKNRSLSYEAISRYDHRPEVLYLLARKNVRPQEYIRKLILEFNDYQAIKQLVKEDVISLKVLEDCVIKSEAYSRYFDIFSDKELRNVNYNLLLFNFRKLPERLDNIDYLSCLKAIIINVPYNEKYHLSFAEILCRIEYANASKVIDIVKYFLNQNKDDFEILLQNRPDILYLFRFLKSRKVNINYIDEFLETYKRRSIKITEDIMFLRRSDVAWCLELYEIGESERINILNYWAQNNQVTAFDTYYEYFTSDNLDYENIGKLLDEEFKNKIVEEPDTPLNRTRKKDEAKIDIPGLKPHGKGLMDFN